jgi:hypothetical protein
MNRDRPDVDTLAAVIAHSQIVVAGIVVAEPVGRLPAGFDEVDIAILEWIATEARRASRSLVAM